MELDGHPQDRPQNKVLKGSRPKLGEPSMRYRVLPIAERIPAGHWVSYGDIAAHIGSHARPDATCMATQIMPNAHRILRSDGSRYRRALSLLTGASTTPLSCSKTRGYVFFAVEQTLGDAGTFERKQVPSGD